MQSTAQSLSSWTLDLDEGTFSLTVGGVASIDPGGTRCSQFRIINQASPTPSASFILSDCVGQMPVGPVEVTFQLNEEDLNSIKLLQNLGTQPSNTFLEISSGNMLFESGTTTEVSPISGTSAIAATVIPDTRSPAVINNGFTHFDLDSGLFTISFTEPVNVATISLPNTLQFQHFSDVEEDSDIFNVGELDCTSSTVCVNGLNVTFPLPRSELNLLKLNQRVCSSAGNCWLTINQSFIQDMAGNPIQLIPDGLRTDVRYPLLFTDDTTGPVLESFELNMTSQMLILSFDEPIDTSACNFSGITLQGAASVLPSQTDLYYTLTGGEILTGDGAVIRIMLSPLDINGLQSRPLVATAQANSFLSLASSSLRDVTYPRNPVQTIPSSAAQQVNIYQPDTAPPRISSFVLDLDSNTLRLTFSEAVLVDQLDLTKLQVTSSSSSGAITRQLTGGTAHPTPLDAALIVVFTLSQDDITFLEERSDIATSISSTYLAAQASFATDTNSVTSLELPISSALQADQLIADSSAPRLVSFALNVNSSKLSLTFDDVINASTVAVDGVTLQNGLFRQPLQWHTLSSDSSNSSLDNGFVIDIILGLMDLNRVKQIRNLATSELNTYLTLTASFADDVFGADILAVTDGNAVRASQYIADTTSPVLNEWTLDLDRGHFILSFSETVDITTIQPSHITLLASPGGVSYSLTGAASFIPSDAADIFAIQLTTADLNYIKSQTGIGTTVSNSYLAMPATAVVDMNSNMVVPILPTSPLQAVDVIDDVSRANLLQFSLDMNAGLLSLTFDETVDASTVNTTALTLVNKPLGSTSSHALSASLISSTMDSHVINITLSQADFNDIKTASNLATAASDTYITATENVVNDMSQNLLAPIIASSALQVTSYTPDTTFPRLVGFSLSMSSGELVLTFSETVTASTLDPTQLTIKNNPGDVGRAITLTGGVVSQADVPTLTLTLNSNDLDLLKLHRDIATSISNTFLALTSTAVQDQADNFVTAVPVNNARQASQLTPDTIPPRLVSFDLNLDTRRAALTFDETIDSTTFVITGVTFQNRATDATDSVTVSALSTTTSSPSTVLEFDLHSTDFNALAAVFPLATMEENTFISIIAEIVRDMNNNPSIAISPSNALQITNHTEDRVRPSLESFDFDLDAGAIFLTFSETVNVTSLNPSQLTLQNAVSAPTSTQSLSGGVTSQPQNNVIRLALLQSDLNQLKANSILTSLASQTYLSLTSSTVQDMNRNFIEPIPMSNAQWVNTFTDDTTGPVLESYDLDFDTGILSMSFDEPILVSTFEPMEVTLSNTGSNSLSLSGGMVLSSDRLTYVRMQLTNSELNELKRLRVCTASNQCTISISSSTVSDVSNNQNSQISSLAVSGYTMDSTNPSVIRFTDFNLDAGSFTLQFSETVDSGSTASRTVEFHSEYVNSTHVFSPLDALNVSADSSNLTLYLEMTDLNLLKLNTELCTHSSNCWVRFPAEFVSDVNGNDVLPILAGTMASYHYPDLFIPDTTPPVLERYDIDLDNGLMTFTFNEIVREATFNPLNISFHNTTVLDVSQALYDQGSFSRSDDGLSISWTMTVPDLNLLKSHVMFFTLVSNSYISYYHLIDDVSGIGTDPLASLQASAVLPDTTRPQLASFLSFSLDNSSFTLLFDEAMNISSLNLEDLAIAENQTYDSSIYDTIYMNPFQSQLFRNGTISNVTHYIQPGRYRLSDCPYSLNFIFEDPTMAAMVGNVTNAPPTAAASNSSSWESGMGSGSASGLGSGSGADVVTMTTDPPTVAMTTQYVDPYPVWLGGCLIELILPVREPWYHLTGGEAFYADERKTQIVVALNRHDARILKLNMSIAVEESSTYIAYNDTAIDDLSGHEITPVSLFNATPVQNFIRDTTAPSLEAFDIDINEGTVTLSFDDVIDLQSLVPTEVILLNSPGSNVSYQIRGKYFSLVPPNALDDYHLQFRLTEDDLNAIKINTDLATSVNNTYICITENVAVDIYGQKIMELPHNKAFVVQNFTADTTRPQLLNFTLDIEDGFLVMTFDEAVDPATIDFSSITIQNAMVNSSASHSLTGGFIENNDTGAVEITIQLVKYDLSAYQSITNFTVSNTFITLLNDTILDMNSNPVVPVDALQVTDVVPQSSLPELESFTLDLNNNFVILTFSKAVNPQTLNASAIQVLNEPLLDASERERLSATSVVTSTEMNAVLFIRLTEEDENNLKQFMREIANSRNDSFLSITFGAVYDFAGAPLNASADDILQAEFYIEGERENTCKIVKYCFVCMILLVLCLKKKKK